MVIDHICVCIYLHYLCLLHTFSEFVYFFSLVSFTLTEQLFSGLSPMHRMLMNKSLSFPCKLFVKILFTFLKGNGRENFIMNNSVFMS